MPILGGKNKIETIKKISNTLKGRPLSYNNRIGISKALKGKRSNMFGKHHSVETKMKMSEMRKKEKHWNWKGGVLNYYPDIWKDTLKESIRQRDNYVCQECGVHQDELEISLDIHHIDYLKDNCELKNLISLCKSCHMKTNYNRDFWIKHFS